MAEAEGGGGAMGGAGADDGELLPGGWPSEEARRELLAKLAPCREDQEEPRVEALLDLRDMATVPEHWEPLWADRELRAALLKCCDPPDPDYGKNPYADEEEEEPPTDKIRMLAISVVLNLAACNENVAIMKEDHVLRHTLVCLSDSAHLPELRRRVFMTLSLLALGGACGDPSDDHVPSRPPTPKTCDTCGLCPCVCTAGEKVWRNSDMEVCHAWLLGAAVEEQPHIRIGVLGALASLALMSAMDPSKYWANRLVRKSVLAGAAQGEPGDVRTAACSALWAFSACDLIQKRMWDDERVRETLLSCAAAKIHTSAEAAPRPQSEDVRSLAFRCLAFLATESLNREEMWRTRRLSAVALQTMYVGGALRAEALKVVVELTKCYGNIDSMEEAGVVNLLKAAAEDESLDPDDRRECVAARGRIEAGSDGMRQSREAAPGG